MNESLDIFLRDARKNILGRQETFSAIFIRH